MILLYAISICKTNDNLCLVASFYLNFFDTRREEHIYFSEQYFVEISNRQALYWKFNKI